MSKCIGERSPLPQILVVYRFCSITTTTLYICSVVWCHVFVLLYNCLIPPLPDGSGLGGWYSYRMSKTALNMATRNLSIELGRGLPKVGSFSLSFYSILNL